MNVLVDFTQIPIQKVGVGVYAKGRSSGTMAEGI